MIDAERPLPRLLMIDDNAGDRQLVALALADSAVAVELDTAGDGMEGRAALRAIIAGERPPCRAVLLDLNMPRLDGREVLRWARAQPALRHLPILVLTSSFSPRDRDECLALGADLVLVKPADYAGFQELVRQVAALVVN